MDQRDLEYINEKFYKSFNESNMTFVVEYYNDDDEEDRLSDYFTRRMESGYG